MRVVWNDKAAAKHALQLLVAFQRVSRGPLASQLLGNIAKSDRAVTDRADNLAFGPKVLERLRDIIVWVKIEGGTTAAGHMHGAAGWVTELAPIWPEFEMRYWELLETGDYKAAQLHRHRLAPLFQFVMDHPSTTTAYSWITVLKAALEYIGLEGGPVRPPFRALDRAEKTELFDLLARLGVPKVA